MRAVFSVQASASRADRDDGDRMQYGLRRMAARAPRPPGTAATILALGLTAWLAVPAHADELDGARVIFVRGSTLFQVDARGKAETEIAQLAAKVTVRALRTDAQGQVL